MLRRRLGCFIDFKYRESRGLDGIGHINRRAGNERGRTGIGTGRLDNVRKRDGDFAERSS
jgi:hypothetical protein